MSIMRLYSKIMVVVGVAVVLASTVAKAQEEAIDAKWYVSGSLGTIGYEGDEELKDGFLGTVRLGYDYSEWWSFEGSFSLAPKLDENFRFDVPTQKRVSRLEEAAGVHSTYGVNLSLDALFHFTRWERLDPYLSAGVGAIIYGDEINGNQFDASTRVGGGVMYHFNDEWAVRADARAFLAGEDTEANAIMDAGVVWTWGAGVTPDITATGGPIDSDGDRLPDIQEEQLGTDPYDPDSDADKLTDGQEVLDYNTDPLNPDSDWDSLQDGAEVLQYKTDPNDRDTDNGGVADGHEVIDDSTDPLDPSDDLQLFELYIQFDYDKAVIKPQYFPELDIIGKVMSRDDGATAVIEGHADRKKLSDPEYNMKLSKRRADSVLQYLVDACGIDAERMEAKGFGFTRPKGPVNLELGNPENRRVEIYIRSGDETKATDVNTTVAVPAEPVFSESPADK